MTPELAAIAAALLITVGYALTCAAWPFKNCRRCHGSGRSRAPMGRAFRRCRRCKGDGARLRTGTALWVWWRRTHSKGTR